MESEENEEIMKWIDRQYLEAPFYGSRRMTICLKRDGYDVNRKRVMRLMRKMGLAGQAPGPNTSKPHPEHKVYPYLVERAGYWDSQSGMEYGYHLYSDEAWLYVPDSCDGLVQPLCAIVGTIKYDGKRILRKGAEERIREGKAGDIQHGSGQPVYE